MQSANPYLKAVSVPLSLAPAKIWRQGFWMKLYDHDTFKRTKLWSTAFAVWKLNLGALNKKRHTNLVATTRKYINSKGEVRFTGTKQLKQTQYLGSNQCSYY